MENNKNLEKEELSEKNNSQKQKVTIAERIKKNEALLKKIREEEREKEREKQEENNMIASIIDLDKIQKKSENNDL